MTQVLAWNFVSPGHHPPSGDLAIIPEYIDLDFLGLFKKEFTKYGRKISVIYYQDFDDASDRYSNPIARVVWNTKFDKSQNPPIPIKQIKKISWRSSDGKWSSDKLATLPIRNPEVYLSVMRSRVIDELTYLAAEFGLKEQILELYKKYQRQIILYKDGGSPQFRDAIATENDEAWLDRVNPKTGNKPRDVLVKYLSISVVEDLE